MKIIHDRQKARKLLGLVSALLFPVTMLYFSPGMVFRGARLGVLSGSYITFAILFISAVVFGRAWCGWLCPVAGLSEMALPVRNEPFRADRLKVTKYIIWVIWLIAIAFVVVAVGGGFRHIDPLLGTYKGISIHNASLLLAYYFVVGIIMAASLLAGKRGFCHTLCWMAPFMVLGRKLGNTLRLPALRLTARNEPCSGCRSCETFCPMSLPVPEMVRRGAMEHIDCILCGACADACANQVLLLSFRRPETKDL